MKRRAAYACSAIPAIVVGLVVMHLHGVAGWKLGVQVFACVLGIGLFALLQRIRLTPSRSIEFTLLTIAMIALTFAFQGDGHVFRWLSLGGLRLHVGAIVCPLLITAATHPSHIPTFDKVSQLAALALLAAQPDAGQATSLGVALVVLIWQQERDAIALLRTLMCLLMVTLAWSRADGLAPVPEVEGIVELALAHGRWVGFIALVALALPVAVIFASTKGKRQLALALGAYCLMTFFVTRLGHFPVPLLGYGAAPILGTFISLSFVASAQLTTH